MEIPTQLARLSDRYRIDHEIGAGGMATVYLAEDVKHHRRVALKVLRPELAAVLGTERFLAEINVTANLQHPHLLPLFDSGDADGLLFYVMPFIAGESLRARLERERQLPVDEALRIATSVLSALDYAHRHGVIHRDLKPENILLHDGQPLIADFGIALAISNAGGARVTQTGLSLGTPQYMSPEQATGDRVIDARSDIYSLAAVLYEMLVGDPPHAASTTQAIIAKLLTEAPANVRKYRSAVPQHVDDAILHALNRLPADRFASAGEFAEALAGVRTVSGAAAPARGSSAPVRTSTRTAAIITAATIVALLSGAGASTLWFGNRTPLADAPVTRAFVPIELPLSADRPLAISPDGRTVAWSMSTETTTGGVWLRGAGELRPRQAAPRGRSPVFSKDGQWLAYLNGGSVMRVPVAGGVPQVVVPSLYFPVSLDWTEDGSLIVVRPPGRVLLIDTATAAIDTIFTDSGGVRWPVLLPHRRALMYTTHLNTDSVELRMADLATGEFRTLLRPAFQARYVESGHLVYARPDSALYAVPFDLRRGMVTGGPVRVLERVALGPQAGTHFDVSRTGVAVYAVDSLPRMALFRARGGDRVPEPLTVGAGLIEGLRGSPEGSRIAFARDRNVHVFDMVLGTTRRITADGRSAYPVWFPAGDSLALQRGADIGRRLVLASADGGDSALVIDRSGYRGTAQGFLRDRRILASQGGNDRQTAWDIVLLQLDPATATAAVTPWLEAEWMEITPALSPDERWVAFVSGETSPAEVWVRPFPAAAGGKWQISSGGGAHPVWSRDGRTLYYWEGAALRAARIGTTNGFQVLDRSTVLNDPLYAVDCCFPNYDVLPDGSIIYARHVVAPPTPGFILVGNWFGELRGLLTAAGQGGAR